MGNILRGSYIDVHEAARSGHIGEVRRWVDAGKPVDALDNTQKTPLHYAAQWGQEETLDFLIECGASVNAPDFIEDTPLHFACYWGHAACVRILLTAGANVSAKDCYGNTPSQIFDDHVPEAILDEIRSMVRDVIKNLPPVATANTSARSDAISTAVPPTFQGGVLRVNLTPPRGSFAAEGMETGGTVSPNFAALPVTCSAVAVNGSDGASSTLAVADYALPVSSSSTAPQERRGRSRLMSISRHFNSNDYDFQRIDIHGATARNSDAADRADSEGLGARPEPAGSVDGSCAPEVANTGALQRSDASQDCLPAALVPRRLVLPWDEEPGKAEGGAGVEEGRSRAKAGGTTTHPALRRPLSAPPVRREAGNKAYDASSFALTPPVLSARANSIAGGEGHLKGTGLNGASLAGTLLAYATGQNGKLDIFRAARDGQVSVLKQALAEGEKVDVTDDCGMTPLMWASRAGRLSTAKYLISQKASLIARHPTTGYTPLHFAAYYCRSAVVRELVIAGADTGAMDHEERVPGGRHQPLLYFSFSACRHRQLIRRFLAGDLVEDLDDRGKTMFPRHAPLEAYDEDHRPQYVRLGSSGHMLRSQGSGENIASRVRRASKRLSGAGLAGFNNLTCGGHQGGQNESKVSSVEGCNSNSVITPGTKNEGRRIIGNGDGGYKPKDGAKHKTASHSERILAGGADGVSTEGSGVHYYVRRTSLNGRVILPLPLDRYDRVSGDPANNDSEDHGTSISKCVTGDGSGGDRSADVSSAMAVAAAAAASELMCADGDNDRRATSEGVSSLDGVEAGQAGLMMTRGRGDEKWASTDLNTGAVAVAFVPSSISARGNAEAEAGSVTGAVNHGDDELKEAEEGSAGGENVTRIRAPLTANEDPPPPTVAILGNPASAVLHTAIVAAHDGGTTATRAGGSDGELHQSTTVLTSHQAAMPPNGSGEDVLDEPVITTAEDNLTTVDVASSSTPYLSSPLPTAAIGDAKAERHRKSLALVEVTPTHIDQRKVLPATDAAFSPPSSFLLADIVTIPASLEADGDEDKQRRRERRGDRERRHRYHHQHKDRDRTTRRGSGRQDGHMPAAVEDADGRTLTPLSLPKHALPPIILGGAGWIGDSGVAHAAAGARRVGGPSEGEAAFPGSSDLVASGEVLHDRSFVSGESSSRARPELQEMGRETGLSRGQESSATQPRGSWGVDCGLGTRAKFGGGQGTCLVDDLELVA